MSINIRDLKFPVMASTTDGIIHFARNIDDLTICGKRAIKNGFYNGLTIIDSNSVKCKVVKATVLETTSVLWRVKLFFEQKVTVSLTFEEVSENPDLADCKKWIIKKFRKEKTFWDSGGDFEEIISFIETAKSTEEIITKLSDDFYKSY